MAQSFDREFFSTPSWVTRRLLDCVNPAEPMRRVTPHSNGDTLGYRKTEQRWLEPCCGDGAISRVLADAIKQKPVLVELVSIDIHKSDSFSHRVADFFDLAAWHDNGTFDFCVMNPPFSQSLEFIDVALKIARVVAALLPLDHLGSIKRCDRWAKRIPDVYVLPERPSFIESGKDYKSSFAWFVWPMWIRSRAVGSLTYLAKTPIEERREG